jgi:hypothetical protein
LIKKAFWDPAASDLNTFRLEPDGTGTLAPMLIKNLSEKIFVVLSAGLSW